ncbi:MAG: hypothetical protein RR373_03600 [Akkermansia sp.]
MMDTRDQQLWDILGKLHRTKAPEGFADVVMARLALESQELQYTKKVSFLSLHRGMVASLAALIVGVVIAFCLMSPGAWLDPDELAQVDDEMLLDVAYLSLGDETLQDAVCRISSPDVSSFGDRDLTEMLF